MSLPSIPAVLEEPFFTVDGAGALVEWNHVVADVVGSGEGEARPAAPSLPDLLAPAAVERVRAAVADARAGERSTVEAAFRTPDGPVPHELRVVPVDEEGPGTGSTLALVAGRRLDANAAAGPVGARDDASGGRGEHTNGRGSEEEHGSVEGSRGEAESRSEDESGDGEEDEGVELLDRVTDAFFAVDRGWRVTYANERGRAVLARAMADVPPEEVLGQHLWEAVPDAVGTTFHEQYTRAMETREPTSFEAEYEPLETWFDVRTYPSETGLSVYFRDVTESRRRREALEERDRVLRRMYDVIADRERSFDEQVDALLALGREVLGTTHGTLSSVEDGEYVVEVMHSRGDAVQAGDTLPLSSTICERMVTDEERLVLDDVADEGSGLAERDAVETLDVQCYLGAPVFVEDEVFGTLCFYGDDRDERFSDWDVTLVDLMGRWVSYELEARRRTEHLREKNERLERFASIVSHDLRNPLAVADGSLELAAETGDGEHFERARRALERMERLVDDLLTLARAGGAIEEPRPVALAPLVRRAWDGCATAGASLSLAAEADRALLADESRLRQLVENLVRNAVEHGGGDVTVRVGSLPEGFFVADDGPGVPEAERERVFEQGYSPEGGTGLGLAIVAEVAAAHGWDVRACESAAGGARFEVVGVELVDD